MQTASAVQSATFSVQRYEQTVSAVLRAEFYRRQWRMKAEWKPSEVRSFQTDYICAENDYTELRGQT